MSSPLLRVATLAFMAILVVDIADGPPADGTFDMHPADGSASLHSSDDAAPDAEFSCERSTPAVPPLLPGVELAPERLAAPRVLATRHGFVPRPFRPPRLEE